MLFYRSVKKLSNNLTGLFPSFSRPGQERILVRKREKQNQLLPFPCDYSVGGLQSPAGCSVSCCKKLSTSSQTKEIVRKQSSRRMQHIPCFKVKLPVFIWNTRTS